MLLLREAIDNRLEFIDLRLVLPLELLNLALVGLVVGARRRRFFGGVVAAGAVLAPAELASQRVHFEVNAVGADDVGDPLAEVAAFALALDELAHHVVGRADVGVGLTV